ncbi:hypothetical protein AMEX_G2027 [Astyanax mexicanus]|uniref:Uncharacterized protein n=1 Tax=Astyanax mexicanus TaxID=7994 RepID=A0A8T2MPD2_ASTMX|nr:hypothetical protein AMEX_G2027 [Astyanax mexicanus]
MKTAAKSKRRPHICVSDLVTYIRDTALVFTGKGQQKRMHNHANSNNLYLEEFEDIVDELLLRLDVITDTDVPDDQEDNDNQSCCSSAHYSSEDVDLENTVGMRKHSCVYSASSYMHEEDGESRLRSPLERKTLQPVGGNRGTIHGRSIFTGQKIHTSITTTPVKKSKDLQTFLCSDHSISVQMNECSETLSSNRAKHFSLTWENKVKNVCTKSWSTQADLTPVLNSSNISRTSLSSHTKAFNQLCISESPVENTETYCELQTVHIPGQCC